MRETPIITGTDDHEAAEILRRTFSGEADREDALKAFSWILARAGMWDRTVDDRSAGRRDIAIDLLDAMGIAQFPNLVDMTEALLSTPVWDVQDPTET